MLLQIFSNRAAVVPRRFTGIVRPETEILHFSVDDLHNSPAGNKDVDFATHHHAHCHFVTHLCLYFQFFYRDRSGRRRGQEQSGRKRRS